MMLSVLVLAALLNSVLAWDGWSTNTSDLVMGLNLGSYLVPEVWMMKEFIQCYANGVIDPWSLDSLAPSIVDEVMIKHLENFIREVDFQDAQARGVNMIRIPVAFWMFIPTEGDEPYWTDARQKDVYLLRMVQWAQQYGMEVIIDLHALPGGQNTDAHSGRNLIVAGLQPTFLNSTNLVRGNATIDAVIEWVQGLPEALVDTVAIIEVINEPLLSAATDYEALVGYYVASQAKIAAALPNVWTMISDAWLGDQSWGDVFTPDQNVVLDLHWWLDFGLAPTLTELHDSYCSLSRATAAHAWQNPILVGEFAAVQNNATITAADGSALAKLNFYQQYYSTQLWAARGSGGRLPLYRGAVVWSMVCTSCGPVWEPYYVIGQSTTLALTQPNWCEDASASSTAAAVAVNPSPVRPADHCGEYYNTTGDSSGHGGHGSGSQGAASSVRPSKTSLTLLMLSVAIVCAQVLGSTALVEGRQA